MSSWIEKDARTGRQYLRLSLPDPGVVPALATALSRLIARGRAIEDGPKLLGDVVVPRVGRPMHRGNLLKFERSGWRMKEAAERLAKRVAGT
ncbi:MAG: hypothetical protein ACYCUE_16405 [Steroidobacteraceae bacterium]|jgi:hypothetical protein